ncbi:MAG: o-succinylbenzoate synthase [Microcystaceae cyanobacterium]
MFYQLTFKPYQREFIRPVKTYHGDWKIREGIIIHLTDEKGKEGWGEIAPIPWFGSESLIDALNFCHSLPTLITQKQILSIPEHLPACQFGFESALNFAHLSEINNTYCYLLPTGKEALQQWQNIYDEKINSDKIVTFKWKIALDSPQIELNLWQQLMNELPSSVKLRLDANGGLSLDGAKLWLTALDRDKRVEFLEQPLPKSEFQSMLSLSRKYQTPIALDESVSSLAQLEQCHQEGWQGIYVIKAPIMGYPSKLINILRNYALDCVFSSVFETEIGRNAALNIVNAVGAPKRALGFGVNNYFISS